MNANNIEFTPSMCIICQLYKDDRLVPATEKGIHALKRSADSRKNKVDLVFGAAIIRIEFIDSDIVYHKSCYATFTSITMISRLADRLPHLGNLPSNTNVDNRDARNEFSSDWTKCILCQEVKKADKGLRQVKTTNMEATIKSFVDVDDALKNRIASGSMKLIDCAVYHLSCLNLYQGMLTQNAVSNGMQNTSFSTLITNLRSDGNEGKVCEMPLFQQN